MTTHDIRTDAISEVTRIRFADDAYAFASCITKLKSGKVVFEDCDEDGTSYPLRVEDVDNFIKARAYARSLGWSL